MKYLTAIIGLLLLAQVGLAQNGQLQDRIESMRIAYITNQLSLTPEESQQFWPIYNKYKEEEKAIRQSYRKPNIDFQSLSDAEGTKLIEDHFDMEQKLLDLKRSAYNDLQSAIPVKKIARLNRAERAFKEKLLEFIQQQRRERKGGRRPGMRNR
jgi:hypothetical protein